MLFLTENCFSQNLNFDKIKFNGLSFYSSKNQIIEKLGSPKKEYVPNYECGDFSIEKQGEIYYNLDYENIKFTGNENEKYVIHEINFAIDKSLILNYENHKLTFATTLNELTEIFGKEIFDQIGNSLNGSFIILHPKYDNGIRIEIKNGKLISFEYWSPC